MNFQGTGKRFSSGDIGKAAKQIGIETTVLLAFLEVEAAGRGFDNLNRPKMLFEPHILYRNLSGALRSRAVALGIAYAKWKSGNYPSDSYPRLTKAIAIDETAALLSASYGLGQIMGFNHRVAGHSTPQEMFQVAKQGEFEQVVQLVTLMKAWGMASMLRPGLDFTNPDNWRSAAKKYNGSGYAKHGYHIKLAEAYKKHSGQSNFPEKVVSSVLKIGSKGETVRNLQADLQTLGYEFVTGIDGRFGNETKENVEDFQTDWGLTVDGIAGEKTLAKIATELKKVKVDKSPDLPVFDKGTGWLKLITVILKAIFK